MGLFTAILGIGSSLFRLKSGSNQKKLALAAFEKSDPFGPYRKQYAEALGGLFKDPSSITQDPLFRAALDLGEQGVARQFAGQGYIGSGNMALGLQKSAFSFGYSAIQDRLKLLAHLAGADITPNFDPALRGYGAGVGTQGGAIKNLIGSIAGVGKSLGL